MTASRDLCHARSNGDLPPRLRNYLDDETGLAGNDGPARHAERVVSWTTRSRWRAPQPGTCRTPCQKLIGPERSRYSTVGLERPTIFDRGVTSPVCANPGDVACGRTRASTRAIRAYFLSIRYDCVNHAIERPLPWRIGTLEIQAADRTDRPCAIVQRSGLSEGSGRFLVDDWMVTCLET